MEPVAVADREQMAVGAEGERPDRAHDRAEVDELADRLNARTDLPERSRVEDGDASVVAALC